MKKEPAQAIKPPLYPGADDPGRERGHDISALVLVIR
jgi:hypothetical protein